jgi:hypothetical protein
VSVRKFADSLLCGLAGLPANLQVDNKMLEGERGEDGHYGMVTAEDQVGRRSAIAEAHQPPHPNPAQ